MLGIKHVLRGPTDAVWLSYVLCQQCATCNLLIDVLIAFVNGSPIDIPQLPPEVLPPDIDVFDQLIVIPEATCAACGCPVVGLPIVSVLVSSADAARLREIGWIDGR